MLIDPVRALHVTLAIGFAAAAWVAIYAVFAERLFAAMGHAAHASVFVAFAAALACAVVALMFRRFARIREALVTGEALARWRVAPAEWSAFARDVAPEVAADHRATLAVILGFAVAIPAAMALLGGDRVILAVIALGIAAVGGLGYALGRRHAAKALRYRDGAVALSRDGLIVNGEFHGWKMFGSRLVAADIDETHTPATLRVGYAYVSRGGEQFVTAYAPVPRQALAEARAAVAVLDAPHHESQASAEAA